MRRLLPVPLLVALATGGCARDGSAPADSATPAPVRAAELAVLDPPAAAGSLAPQIAVGGDGRVYLSWIEPAEAGSHGHVLRFSVREAQGWSPPRTAAAGVDWFVNWADVPSVSALADGTLAAHWLVKSAADPYAYDVWLALSTDGGRSFGRPLRPHSDGVATEHGFVTLVPGADAFDAVWLDGRELGSAGHGTNGAMTLRHARIDRHGRLTREERIDERVCDCCPTDAVRATDGALVVAYRDRSEEEIRDIALARREAGGWTPPRAVHADGWKIAGCPVNGPALARAGQHLALAWFSGAEDAPRVRVAFSDDGGRRFSPPLRVDGGDPLGRVDLALAEDGTAIVVWLERTPDGAELRVRRVPAAGDPGPPLVVARTAASRSSGVPRLAHAGGETILVWTEPGEPSRVRGAVLLSDG